MKQRLRSSPKNDDQPNGQSTTNGHREITINDGSISRNEAKVHGRRRKGLGSAVKLLALPFAAVLLAPFIFYQFMPPFRGEIVTERTFANEPAAVVRMNLSTSHLPRRAMYRYRIRKPPEQPRASAKRRTQLFNKESIMMTEKFAKKLEDSHDYDHKARDSLHEGDCEPMRPWQETLFPSCSVFHELDMSDVHSSYLMDKKQRLDRRFRKINGGGYNDVFNFHRDPPTEEDIVCKTLGYGTDYTDRNFDRVRRDALIAERATKSRYMVDIYGHCGLSQLAPLGTEGTLSDALYERNDSQTKLTLARHAALGLGAAHDLDGDGVSSVTQGDLKADQYLLVDAYFKLGDFNRGRFLRRNKVTGETCPYTIGHNDAKYRSPEEYRYDPETAKIDVWALGSIIYLILTGEGVWRGVSERKAQKRISEGEAPPLDEKWRKSKDPVDALLVKVMYEMCFVADPEKRASAPEVAKYMEQESDKIMKTFKLTKKTFEYSS